MSKVFGIGLSRTGTSSLSKALGILGYESAHWPKSLGEIHVHGATTDITVSSRYRELDLIYPGAKFILTVRKMDSWVGSCLFHYRHEVRYDEIPEPNRSFCWEAERILYGEEGGFHLDPRRFRAAYETHREGVLDYFRNRPQDLLVIDILAGEGWEKLCPFLKKRLPVLPFPHLNQRVVS